MSTKQTPLSAFKKQVTFKNNRNISSRQNDKTRKKEVTTMVNKSSEMSGSSQVPKTKSSDVCFTACKNSLTPNNGNLKVKNISKSSKKGIGGCCATTGAAIKRTSSGVGFLTSIKTSNNVCARIGLKGIQRTARTTISDSVEITNLKKNSSSSKSKSTNKDSLKNENKTLNKINEHNEITIARTPSPSTATTIDSASCTSETCQAQQHNLLTRVAWNEEKYPDTTFHKNDVIIEYDENISDVISSRSSSPIEDIETESDHVNNIEYRDSDKIISSNDEDYDTDVEEEFPGLLLSL